MSPNRMKTTWITIATCLTATPLLPSTAHAGNKEGNGGGAIVCVGPQGALTAELLDLWEAEHAPDQAIVIPNSNVPASSQLEEALLKLAHADPSRVAVMREVLAGLSAPGKRIPIDSHYRLPPPTDTRAGLLPLDRNCSLQGVASFDDSTGELEYDPVILAAMGPTDRAALDFHEALYKAERMGPGEIHVSSQARKLTAAVFGPGPLTFTPVTQGIESATFECDAQGDFHFFIVPQESGKLRFQFTRIDRRDLTDLTYFELGENAAGSEGFISDQALLGFNQFVYSDPHTRTQTPASIFSMTTSRFEPSYPMTIALWDTVTGHWQDHYLANGGVEIEMYGDSRYQPYGAWGIHCTKR